MPNSTAVNFPAKAGDASDREVWQNLKNAIANSSGFQRWMLERQLKNTPVPEKTVVENKVFANKVLENTDKLVRSYLRETLETLAY